MVEDLEIRAKKEKVGAVERGVWREERWGFGAVGGNTVQRFPAL
jgi:hypothetical protein